MLNFLLFAASSAALPVFVAYSLCKPRLRSTLLERLGFGNWRNFKRSNDKVIWLHAASLGEISGVVPVVKKLRELFPKLQIVATCTSDTGRKALVNLVDDAFILPFDHPALVGRALDLIKPDLIAISETEIWPSFLISAKHKAIPILFFNARVSDYTYDSYKRFAAFLRPILATVNSLYAQTQIDLERFSALGIQSSYLAGSTKCDIGDAAALSAQQIQELRNSFGFEEGALCLVAGSVHPVEDLAVVKAYKKLSLEIPNLKMIIAPRHNFESAAAVLKQEDIEFTRRSEGNRQNSKVILLDTIGELSKVYSLASVAYVGGSLVDVGGHNPFEPAVYSVPVVMGNYITTVRDSAQSLQAANALFLVNNSEELYQALKNLLTQPTLILTVGASAKNVLLQSQGATEKVVQGIKPFLLALRG